MRLHAGSFHGYNFKRGKLNYPAGSQGRSNNWQWPYKSFWNGGSVFFLWTQSRLHGGSLRGFSPTVQMFCVLYVSVILSKVSLKLNRSEIFKTACRSWREKKGRPKRTGISCFLWPFLLPPLDKINRHGNTEFAPNPEKLRMPTDHNALRRELPAEGAKGFKMGVTKIGI